MKVTVPSHFQCPNDLVDHWLPELKEAELKILLLIIRKTFGWHKERDRISLSQMVKITGLVKNSVCNAVTSLIEKNIILKEIEGELGNEKVYYSLIIEECSTSTEFVPPQYKDCTPPSTKFVPTKDTNTKDTNTKETTAGAVVSAAAVSSNSKDQKPKIFECLKSLDIPESEKIQISSRPNETEERVAHAVKFATHPMTKISKGIPQTIKWALNEPKLPEIPKLPEDKKTQNKTIAERTKACSVVPANVVFEVLNECVEFSQGMVTVAIRYTENGFKDQLISAIKRFKITQKK